MKYWNRLGLLLVSFLFAHGLAIAQAAPGTPGTGWSWDPAKQGMVDLRAVKPIEGCLAPGGLQRITDSDEPGSAQFWCGIPPFCLTSAGITASEQCRFVPYCRRSPRGDASGAPGQNSCREPEDLVCVNTGLPPIAGRCPLPPELTSTITPPSVQVGQSTTLSISSPHATSLSMVCTGANSAFPPYSQSNLNAYAGQAQVFAASQAMLTGATNCTITASNVRGTRSQMVSFTAVPVPPAPTVSAAFTNSPVPADGSTGVVLVTNTTNATSLTWTCSGIWSFGATSRPVGSQTTTNSQGGGSGAGRSANCTFTATGPGGTRSTTASWSAVASGGGGGSGGGTVFLDSCAPQTVTRRAAPNVSTDPGLYCRYNVRALGDGQRASVSGQFIMYGSPSNLACRRMFASTNVLCSAGTVVLQAATCSCGDTQR